MNNTKDKVKYGTKEFIENEKSKFGEAFSKINLIEYTSKTKDEISKNSIQSSADEYDSIYLEDEVYLSLIKDLHMYKDLRYREFTKISSKDNEERDSILNYINSELDPRIEELEIKIDIRRSEINSDREAYIKESDEKKTPGKNAMLALSLGTSTTFALVTYPKSRKIIIDGGKKLAGAVIKKGTNLL